MGLKHFLPICSFIMFVAVSVVNFSDASQAWAQVDSATEKGMKDTQNLLRDKKQRDELIKTDSKAKEADSKVNAVTGGDAVNNQKLYDISADIMPALMTSVGNDPVKAMELLQKAQSDPEAFYKSLPSEVRDKIRGVASDIESKGSAKKNP